MAYKIVDVDPDDVLTDPAPAAVTTDTAAPAVPVVGPKNVYKYALPDITEADLPDIDIGQPAAAAKPAPKIIDVDPNDILINPSEVYNPKSDTAFTRGAKSSYTGMERNLLGAADVARILTLPTAEAKQAVLDIAKRQADPRNATLQEPSFTDVHSFGEGATYVGESLGQMFGSVGGAAVYGGAPGAVIGGAAGSVLPGGGTLAGALTGGTIGMGTAFLVGGPTASLEAALQDKAVVAAIQNDTLDPHKLVGLTTGAGLLVGALDAFAPTKFVMKVAGKEITKDGVKVLVSQAIKLGLLKGTAAEGGTEAVQQAIDEATQALAGGDIKLAERAVNVLNSFIVGTIGGAPGGALAEVTENARLPSADLGADAGAGGGKQDEDDETTVGEAGAAVTPGVADPTAVIGANAGGDQTAKTPAAPAGSGAKLTQTQVVTTAADDVDPTLKAGLASSVGGEAGAGPQATRTDQEVIEEGAIPEDVEETPDVTTEQTSELERLTREAIAAHQAEVEADAAKAQETSATTAKVGTGDIATEVKAALDAQETKKSRKPRKPKTEQSAAAAAIPVPDPSAGLAAVNIEPGAPAVTGENLGTGVNLQRQNVAAFTPPEPPVETPAAVEPEPPAPAVSLEPEPLARITRDSLAQELGEDRDRMASGLFERVNAALDEENDVTLVRGDERIRIVDVRPEGLIDDTGKMWRTTVFLLPRNPDRIDITPPVGPAPLEKAAPAVTAAAPTPVRGPVRAPVQATPAEIIRPAAAQAAVDVSKSKEPPAKPLNKAQMIAQRAKEAALAREAAKHGPAAKQETQETAPEPERSPDVQALRDVLPVKEALAAAAAKEVSAERTKLTIGERKAPVTMEQRGKVIEAPKAEKGVTYDEAKDVVVEERAPEAETRPAPASEAVQARRREVSEQVASEVRSDPSLDPTDGTSPLLNLPRPLVHQTISDVAAEFTAREPAGQAASMTIRNLAGRRAEMLAEVVRRLESDIAEYEKANRSLVEKLENARAAEAEGKAAAAAAKREEQAKAETGQKKERIKAWGLSAEGIEVQSSDSLFRQEKKEDEKPEAQRDPLVKQHARLVRERDLKSTTAERRAEVIAEIADLKEERMERARAYEAADKTKEKHAKVEAEIERALHKEGIERPTLSGKDTDEQQNKKAVDYLKAFYNAIKGLKIAGRHDRVHNTPLENLAVYAKKLIDDDGEVIGQGASEFWQASGWALTENPTAEDLDQFSNMVTTTMLGGTELREEITDDSSAYIDLGLDNSAAGALEEGNVADRTRRQDLFRLGRKGGRLAAVTRSQWQAIRDAKSGKTAGATVTTWSPDGTMVTIEVDSASAASRLREIDPNENLDGRARKKGIFQPFLSLFRNMHIRRLSQLVGDIQVHIISSADMERIGAGSALGLYRPAADGNKAMVFITEAAAADIEEISYSDVLVHELTHAATVMAYDENLRGTRDIIDRMRVALLRELRKQGFTDEQLHERGVAYGLLLDGRGMWTGGVEFIAEAFSNRLFQHILANYNVPRSIQREIAAIAGGRPLSWWELFARTVSNAIGMVRGQRGQTYMEQMIALYPHMMQSLAAQDKLQQELANKYEKSVYDSIGGMEGLPRARARGPTDVYMFKAEFGQRVDGLKDWATSGWMTVGRQKIANALRTLGDMQRRAAELMGGTDNPFQRLGDVLLRKDPLRAKYRKMGEAIELALAKFENKSKAVYVVLSKNLHEATRFKVDHTVPLTHANNKHIPKTGEAGEARRQAHARLSAAFNALPAEAQALAREAAAHYRKSWDHETKATVAYVVKAALKTYRARDKLPAGKTEDDVVKWVLDKGAARKEDERTAEDKEFREALGSAADRLADITEQRGIKGIYFPLARRGKWFITAVEKLLAPAGSYADPEAPDGNRFIFTDPKKATAFTGSTEYLTNTTSRYVDPQTGKRAKTKEGVYINAAGQVITPVRQLIVTVQNKHMIMHDNRNTLLATAKQLAADGHQVSAAALTRQMLQENTHQDILPSQIATLLKHVEQTTIGSTTIGQQAVQDAIRESAIRAMTTPSKLTSHLKRTGQMGYDMDLTSAMREHNRAWASHMANMELAPDMADHQAALDKHINDRRRTEPGKRIEELQLLKHELMRRFKDLGKPTEETGFSRFADSVMNVSFMRHLFSPHYTIINLLQPLMTTYPVVAAKYGHGAAWRETVRFYRMGGVSKALGRGFSETWNSGRNLNPYSAARVTDTPAHNPAIKEYVEDLGIQDRLWFDLTVKEDDAAELHPMYRGLIDRGYGAAAGLEAGAIAEEEMNTAEKTLNRLATVAKGLPEAAESINRYHTATIVYRLARRAGKSVADAQREAWLTVEQTQGGYARANSPLMFNNPLLRAPLQFKKYGVMYGQLFYGNLTKLMAPSSDPETRKLAAKTLARMSLTTMAFAGVGGLPMIEVARILANTAVAMGLSDDDWEDWEIGVQQWFAGLIGGVPAEALMHGATRLAGVDTSAALGADNLVTFGQPKTLDAEGTMAWIGKMMIGASGGMAIDTVQAINQGDILGAFPWPKFIKNFTDAYGLYNEGTVNKRTGEQYAPPVNIGEAVTKGLGFNPASSARQWETGTGHASKEQRQAFSQRTDLMGRWVSAKQRGHTAEAQRIFQEEVRRWNASHKEKQYRIDMGDLMRSRKERERRKRELQKSLN